MKWISVKERLPKKSECGLLSESEHGWAGQIPIIHKGNRRNGFVLHTKDGGTEIWPDMQDGYDHAKEVTHWLPLPESPDDLNLIDQEN